MESLSMQLQPFFEWLLRTTLQASLLICLILLFQAVLRNKLGARWHYCLWLLLLIRMAMPWAPQSRLSVFNLIPQSVPQRQTEYARQEVGDDAVSSDAASPSTAESTPVSTTEVVQDTSKAITVAPEIGKEAQGRLKPVVSEIADILPLIWLTGTLILAVYVCANNFNLLRIVKRERPLTDQKILDLLEDCKAEMGIRIILGIVTTDKVKSPALFGFIRPRLLLPKGMLETLSREELRYVFLHELAHLKRHDIYIGWLISLLQVLHWFNPLIWLAFYRVRTDRELACDALVLARTQSSQAKDYGRTIVNLLERFSRSQRLPAMAGILETKAQLKRRITMITRFKKNSYQWSPWSILLIIILACISLPDARRTRASETLASKPAHQPNFRKIWIPTKPGNGVLSPDGKKLAFVSKRSIWVVPVHGKVSPDIAGEPVRLPGTKTAWHWGMRWSADGRWIAYNTLKDGIVGICIVPSSGGKVKRIVNEYRAGGNVFDCRLSLSRDGRTVAYGSKVKDKMQIFTADVESGDFKQLTGDGGKQPCFSPDGKKIAFVKPKPQKKASSKSDIWVIPATGGEPIQVSNLPGRATGPVWSPDGKRIAFTRKTGGDDMSKEICIVPIPESGKPEATPTQIELPLETWRHLAGWTPDNEIGVLLSNPEHQAIYTVPASGGNATQVTPQGYTFHPRWSPDGERIYFRWNGGNIASVPSEGGEISIGPLHANSGIFVALPGGGNAVSPDGKKITFSGARKVLEGKKRRYEVDIYTIPVGGGKPTRITRSPGQDRYPCWSPDGKSIAFIRYGEPSKEMSICIVPTEGGEVRQLTSETHRVLWSTIAWSPDGKLIAYFNGKNINVIPAEGGEPRVVVKVEGVSSHSELAWSPDGSKLVYSSKGSIWVVSLDGGEPEEIKTGLDAKATHISWSPDGKKIAFTGSEGGDTELWLMENFLQGAPVAKPEPAVTLRRVEVRGRGYVHSRPSLDGKYMSDVDFDTGNLVVRDIATGKERMLTKNSDPNWFAYESLISPENKRVAFLQFNPKKEDFDLRVVGFDGSDDQLLWGAEEGARSFDMDAWSPDGRHIFGKLIGQDESVRLIRVSADDGSRQVIKTFEGKWLFKVDVSPDGRYVAYDLAEQKTSNPDIFVFDLEENRETPLVKHPANDKLLGWTPDGQHIFFTSDRNGTWDGWLLRVEDGKPRGLPEVIKAGMGDVSPIGFTRSGSFYYNFWHEAWNVYTAKLDLDTGEALSAPSPVRHVGKDVRPDWSPDGQYLAYCSEPDRNKPQVVRIRTLATGQERELKTDLPFFDWLRWCPDSRHLLITNFNRGSPSVVYKLDVQTGEHTALVQSDEQRIRQAELSADGKTLAYRIRGSGNANWLIVRDMETGREKKLLRSESMGAAALLFWALSPDGKHVALSVVALSVSEDGMNRAFVLKIISVASGETRTVVGDSAGEPAWINDGRDLLFVKGFKELWRVSAEGGEPRKLWEWKQMLWGLRIHPDGQRIAFFSGGNMSEMWVMENFLPTGVSQAK